MGCHLQLKWSKFGLTHHHPASFGTAQWQERETVSVPYLLYRFTVFAFLWVFFIYYLAAVVKPEVLPYIMIYLTIWTYMTAMLDAALQLFSSCIVAFKHHYGIDKPVLPPWLYKTQWVIVNISHTMEPFVTALYWGAVYPQIEVPVTYSDVHLHLLTTIYTVFDLFVHDIPRRYYHVTFPLCYGIAYLLFTAIYYLCGGLDPHGNTGIYPILDWARPGMTAGVAVGAVVAIFLLHGLTWGIVRLRLRLHGQWFGKKVRVEAGMEEIGGAAGGRNGDDEVI